MANQSGGWLRKLGDLLVPPSQTTAAPAPAVTNTRILNELVACFEDSISQESVGASMLFNAHFLIILHPDVYEDRLNAFPVIVNEAVSAFNQFIDAHKANYGRVSPVASSWFFKFGAGREFNGEAVEPADVRVVGALTGILSGNQALASGAAPMHVTQRVQQTNRYEKIDVDQRAFLHIDFREPGAFVVKFSFEAPAKPIGQINSTVNQQPSLPRSLEDGLAQIRYYVSDKNQDATYLMRDREIVIARKEADNQQFSNYLLLESVYVSNPHARIRYNEITQGFELASFSRNETRINERVVPRSEPANPQWHELPDKAQILLNSMVTLQFNRNL
ncbi:FHA domain-containing protein [Spirosoma sp. KUDC1026]|uniref:FHA domain-containing protein n=1 Tax=Spirosoma sp. KUDC1026 TaxID=2745947 RepID=UPI00159BAC62|nr:FHA domain-containing protein [Spirosoma sp. KUDC1026]QKZ15105.1 FHA domain-containing protein [Spirosoma sp. KUDC1026]